MKNPIGFEVSAVLSSKAWLTSYLGRNLLRLTSDSENYLNGTK